MLYRVTLFALLVLLLHIIYPLTCSAFIRCVNEQEHTRSFPVHISTNHRRRRRNNYAVCDKSTSIKSNRLRIRSTAPSTTATQLSLLHPTAGASLALIGSSLCGMQISRFIPSGGILGTLVSAAFFGNCLTHWGIPNKHPLYDLCFTLFLPSSLTLLLLAYMPPTAKYIDANDHSNATTSATDGDIDSRGKSNILATNTHNSISTCIRRIAMPFLITSLASLLGCWLSYRCALVFRWFQFPAIGVSSTSARASAVGKIKAKELARITTGCMSASYVGGSVNFMSTARLIGAPADLLGSLVTADLFTMAIYFSFLSSSLDWEWLVSKFSFSTMTMTATTTTTKEIKKEEEFLKSSENKPNLRFTKKNTSSSSSPTSELNHLCLASIPLLLTTFLIVQMANRVEDIVGRFVPGTTCALIAIVTPILNSFVQDKTFWRPFSRVATLWSDFFFFSFFASIGVAANLSSTLSMGPTCLLFSTIALMVHVVGTVFGCLFWKRCMVMLGHGGTLDLEDVWIASNAAIGGPATAAAFCGRMKKRDPDKLRGRTISATVWGVVGYAIGTIVGVNMYRMVG
mmetsp:Transcript_24517/g.24783  ORF Transcript_24517/g.24783 Transcript_24517/m.24783 type:complete len:571 (+) Transcript_24517:89-1801(+)